MFLGAMIFAGCQSDTASVQTTQADGSCYRCEKTTHQNFSVKGAQWNQTQIETRCACVSCCEAQSVVTRDAGTTCNQKTCQGR
jgi:hypothetical protein